MWWGYRVGAMAVSAVLLVSAFRLVAPATAEVEAPGVRQQLAFLREALDEGAANEAQGLFPEGYFFLHVLYGLTWVEFGRGDGDVAEAEKEARWALDTVDTPAGRAPFSADLVPAYGVFYVGWTNWLRGGVLSLQPAARRDPELVRRFEADSAALADAFDASASPYLMAYPDQAWPCDSTVAVASLRLHDAILPPRFGGTVDRWVAGVRNRLMDGLMPHRADPRTGQPLEVARGTSQSIIHRFLVDIDADLAREQYLRFRDRYVVSPLGLGPAVREYPQGMDGPADVDSGPLPLGVSLSATVVTLGAAQVQGDQALASALANYGELLGLPVTTPWTKRYALGLLPVGDAFLAWSKTAHPWVAPVPVSPAATVSWLWRVPLLALLLAPVLLVWLPEVLRRIRRSARG